MIERFRYLNLGLAAVLVFVGLKMTFADVYALPVCVSLVVIVLTLALAVGASMLRPIAPVAAAPSPAGARTGDERRTRAPAMSEGGT
jgi:predicted tellurium resistance membrane protein TerC